MIIPILQMRKHEAQKSLANGLIWQKAAALVW